MCAGSGACLAWLPGYPTGGKRMATGGFELDPNNRDEAVSFYHAVYQASEGYEKRVGWTGSFPDTPGTTSAVFEDDVERRINYFRAVTGVHANTRVNTDSPVLINGDDPFKPAAKLTKAAATRSAALMIAASYDSTLGTVSGMSHDPRPHVPSWSPAAWNAAANGNLAFGTFGPGAVDEYVVEELLANSATSEWNSLVGHRRWLLASDSTDFATGDYPGESAFRPPSNVMYVVQRNEEIAVLPETPFVSYPPAGYSPARFNSRFWSLSHKDADFSAATVKVVDAAGAKVPVVDVKANSFFGEPALIWQVSGIAAARTTTSDRRYKVTVQGIQGEGVPTSLTYDVVFFNPVLLRRLSPISVVGKAQPGKLVKLEIKPFSGARSSRVVQYQRSSKAWTEDGEGKKPDVIDKTSPVYPLLAVSAGAKGMGAVSGSKSFNLTFPQVYDLIARGVPEQIMELGPWVHTKTGSTLEFVYRRGLMSDATSLVVEVSTDQGVTWKSVGKAIKGDAGARPDVASIRAVYGLPKVEMPLRVRFRYFYAVPGGPLTSHLDQPGFPTGIFLDDIKLMQCDILVPLKAKVISGKSILIQAPVTAKPGDILSYGLESEFGGAWMQTGPLATGRIVK
jgi:hypothetical protein